MLSKFAKKRSKFIANRIFTDRVTPTRAFENSIKSIVDKPQQILVYYGKGGIGKTRLLQQLYGGSEEIYLGLPEYNFHNVFISFDARGITDEISVMMNIRNKLHGDGGLFDYAVLCYWAKMKLSVDDVKNKYASLPVNVRKVLDDVAELGGGSTSIPAFILQDAKGMIRDEGLKYEYGEEIDGIDELSDAEIFERLPFYLGLCVSAAAQKGHIHVFFFDAYEHMKGAGKDRDWFMEFLASCEVLRACIASRDKLRWGLSDEDWDSVLDQHLLENLSDEDSRWFLRNVPINEEEVIEQIVAHSGGVPLFLDMSVDLYQDDINNGRTPDLTRIKHGEKLIDRYMDYLDDDSASAVKLLSVPDCFNADFALYLLSRQGLKFSEKKLRELFEKSIVLSIDSETDAWKIDESVRIHLMAETPKKRVAEILADMLSYVKKEGDGRAFGYFASVLNTVKRDPECMVGLNEAILEQIDYFGNSGYWMELDKMLSPFIDSEDKNLRAVAVMAENVFLRRTGSLKEGEEFLLAHPLGEEELKSYYFLYVFQKITYRHLQGFYDEALKGYEDLLKEMDLIKNLVPTHVYNTVCMKYADLLFLKGMFERSLSVTEKLLGEKDVTLVEQIELMRIKGHIFRFRRQYDEARIIYASALKLIREKKLSAYLGKLYTNMTEVGAFTAPLEALEWFEKAKLVNEKSGNLIELGKAYAAAAEAHACIAKDLEGAQKEEHIKTALELAQQGGNYAKKAGYRSGEAFALVGKALAYKHAGRNEEYDAATKELADLTDELNVYKYLLELVK